MFEWLNKDSVNFLSSGYLSENQTAQDRVREIANAAEKILKIEGFADKFFDYMGRGFYSLSSPIWSNFGNDKGLPISCNGVYVGDSIEKIMSSVSEVAIQTKHGAGTSGHFSDIRPRGSKIKTGGVADGPVHYMNIFETITDIISQGSVRRGSFAAYLDIEHPDVLEFLNIREVGNSIQNLSIGLCVGDEWMKAMIAEGQALREGKITSNDAKRVTLWAAVLRKRRESGYPYLFFKDTVNRNKPKVLLDRNIDIKASNLCLKGNTVIKVKFESGKIASFTIEEFVKDVWNETENFEVETDEGFKKITRAFQSGNWNKMVRLKSVRTKLSVECTPDHKIFTQNRGWVEAKYVLSTDILKIQEDYDDSDEDEEIKLTYIDYDSAIPVYDLTVPDGERFFANGILVHNCSEIALPSSDEWSFVCNLSSMNCATYDEWKNTDAVQILTIFLDAVMEEYIKKTNKIWGMKNSNSFAKHWRAIGIGQLGWATYLQNKMVPFESQEAVVLAEEISRHIDEESLKASRKMAELYGEPEGLKGYGERNLTRTAIAPTTSSSFILGQVSPSIEPLRSNYFTKNLAKGQYTFKNPSLTRVLDSYNKNDKATWNSILQNKGSVQHLDFLSELEKEVFKTFDEINQMSVIEQAAARQRYIDQSQSLNLLFPHTASPRDINSVIIAAWEKGVKSLYYQRSTNPSKELVREMNACVSCEA